MDCETPYRSRDASRLGRPRVRRLDLAFDFPGLKMRDRVVLLVIARRSNGTGSYFQSQQRLAVEAGCSVRTARQALCSLSDLGLVRKVRGPADRVTVTYRVMDEYTMGE
jgi:DNA-binding MarR family transcriptional regulator